MATSIKIELDRDGIRALLRDPAVQALLDDKARAVARAAEGRGVLVGGDPGTEALPISTRSAGGARARAVVGIDHPAGLAVEAKHRLLVGSLDAARS